MRSCAVCKKTVNKENVPLFRVPKCEKSRLKWSAICGIAFTPTSRLCIKHFSRSQIITAGRRSLLMPNAEPVMHNEVLTGLPDAYDPLMNIATRTPPDQSFQKYPVVADLPMLIEKTNVGLSQEQQTQTNSPISYDDLCRICAKTIKGEKPLGLFEDENSTLLLKIKDLTGIQLSNETRLPKLICLDCNNDISEAYKKFREDFLKVQALFNLHIRGIKQQKCNRLIKEREFVQIFVNEEETNISVSDYEPIFEKEKEINIRSNEILSFEDNSLEDTKNAVEDNNGTKLEYIDRIDTFSDLEVKEIGESDEEFGEPISELKHAKENPNVFICEHCGYQFNNHSTFKIHLNRHSGVKQCVCELCKHKFFTNGELRRHMRKHTGEKPYTCRFCSRRYTCSSTRTKHERTHTNERPYACHLCGKSFTASNILKNHILMHTGEKEFKCDLCNREFARKTHLDVHFATKMHKEAVEGDKLGRQFTDSRTRIKCKTERRYVCSVCGRSFRLAYTLKNHMLTHTGVKDFKCDLCNKKFSRKTNLDQHFATKMHNDAVEGRQFTEKCKTEKQYVFSVSDRSFIESYILRKNHNLTHTDVKEFKCDACNKVFARKSQLDAHFATEMHKQSVENNEHLEFQE